MALVDIVKGKAEEFAKINSIEEAFNKNPHDSDVRTTLGALVNSITPQEPATFAISSADHVVDQYIKTYSDKIATRLDNAVIGHYEPVLGLLDKDSLIALALSSKPDKLGGEYADIEEKHKQLLKLMKGLQTKDLSAYINTVEDKALRNSLTYRSIAHPERVLEDMKTYTITLDKELREELKNQGKDYIKGYLSGIYKKTSDKEQKAMRITAGSLVR